MLNIFLSYFKVTFAISANTFIYFLKRIPLLGKKIPDKLYKETEIKIILGVMGTIFRMFLGFFKKSLYLGIMVLLPSFLINNFLLKDVDILPEFLHIFFFLSFFIGVFLIPVIFDKGNKAAYNMIILMRADAKEFYLMQLIYTRITDFIFFILPMIIIGLFIGLAPIEAIILMIEFIAFRIAGEGLLLFIYEKTGKRLNDNEKFISVLLIVGILLAYALPSFGITFKFEIILLNFVSVVISIILSVMALKYLFQYSKYKIMAKQFLNRKKVFEFQEIMKNAKFADVKVEEDKMGNNEIDTETFKDKNGYEYLNHIFFLRYKRIIEKPIITRVKLIGILFAICAGIIIFSPESRKPIAGLIHDSAPVWVFIMYMMSTTQRVCKAMFHNCDVSLLRYPYYREGKVILSNFTLRLKKIVLLNLIPAFGICIALILTLIISGASNLIIGTIPIFICLICLACFFSIHHLFLYYVIQPYTKDLEVKSPLFSIANGAVYLLSYGSLQIKTPSLYFAYGVIGITVIYMMVALTLTYKLAPKTFRLK